jgi:hypothetical protein
MDMRESARAVGAGARFPRPDRPEERGRTGTVRASNMEGEYLMKGANLGKFKRWF